MSGGTFANALVSSEVYRVFGKDAPDAIRVFTCESGLVPSKVGDSFLPSTIAMHSQGLPFGESIGIAQVRLLPGRPDRQWLANIYNNITYAHQIFSAQGWQPWSCKKVL